MDYFYLRWGVFICLLGCVHMDFFYPMKPMAPFSPMQPMGPFSPMKPMEPVSPVKPMEPFLPIKQMEPFSPMKPFSFEPITSSQTTDKKESETTDNKVMSPDDLDTLYAEERFDELAKALQLESEEALKPYSGDVRSDKDLMHSKGGDIIFSQKQKQMFFGSSGKRRVARQGTKFDEKNYVPWSKFIPYAISKNFTSENRQRIEDAISEFNILIQNEMLVKWFPGHKDFIMFFDGNGCSSHIGKNGGPQAVFLSQSGCMKKGVIQHEIFHTIGVVHEHNRPDRDKYIKIKYENIPEDWLDQYSKYSTQYIEILGDYDYLSIMHYPLNAPESEDKQAIEILQSGVNITKVGQREEMTATDIMKLKKLYSFFPNALF